MDLWKRVAWAGHLKGGHAGPPLRKKEDGWKGVSPYAHTSDEGYFRWQAGQ